MQTQSPHLSPVSAGISASEDLSISSLPAGPSLHPPALQPPALSCPQPHSSVSSQRDDTQTPAPTLGDTSEDIIKRYQEPVSPSPGIIPWCHLIASQHAAFLPSIPSSGSTQLSQQLTDSSPGHNTLIICADTGQSHSRAILPSPLFHGARPSFPWPGQTA